MRSHTYVWYNELGRHTQKNTPNWLRIQHKCLHCRSYAIFCCYNWRYIRMWGRKYEKSTEFIQMRVNWSIFVDIVIRNIHILSDLFWLFSQLKIRIHNISPEHFVCRPQTSNFRFVKLARSCFVYNSSVFQVGEGKINRETGKYIISIQEHMELSFYIECLIYLAVATKSVTLHSISYKTRNKIWDLCFFSRCQLIWRENEIKNMFWML